MKQYYKPIDHPDMKGNEIETQAAIIALLKEQETPIDLLTTLGSALNRYMLMQIPKEILDQLPLPASTEMFLTLTQLAGKKIMQQAAASEARAIAIALGELVFDPGELAQILEGRQAQRDITEKRS